MLALAVVSVVAFSPSAGLAPIFTRRRHAPILAAELQRELPAQIAAELAQEEGLMGEAEIASVRQALELAWTAAWQEQSDEITALEQLIQSADAADAEAPRLEIGDLWALSENRSDASQATRLQRSRELTSALMGFWRRATPQLSEEDAEFFRQQQDDDEIAEAQSMLSLSDSMPAMTAATASRQRLRLLQRHREAGLVEYRIVGERLSRDAAALDQLPAATLVDFGTAWRLLGSALNRTRWLDDVVEAEEMTVSDEERAEIEQSIREILVESGVDLNETELADASANATVESLIQLMSEQVHPPDP